MHINMKSTVFFTTNIIILPNKIAVFDDGLVSQNWSHRMTIITKKMQQFSS